MRLVRFQSLAGPQYGALENACIRPLHGDPFGRWELTDDELPAGEMTLLAPMLPSKILAVGLNYASHLQGRAAPEQPELFWKPSSAVVGPFEPIVIPEGAQDVHAEGELVIVIGRRAHGLRPDEAAAAIFGYTIGNDVSERTWQQQDRQWWRAKGCDTFAPIGPEVVTGLDWRAQTLTTEINGEVVQSGRLEDLLFDVPAIVAFASAHVTLLPGDLIFTGTPGHTRALRAGDTVSVTISNIGALTNPVTA